MVRMTSRKYTATMLVPKKIGTSYSRLLGQSRRHERSSLRIRDAGPMLEVKIETSDITALRASMNTVMRDIQVIEGAAAATAPRPTRGRASGAAAQ